MVQNNYKKQQIKIYRIYNDNKWGQNMLIFLSFYYQFRVAENFNLDWLQQLQQKPLMSIDRTLRLTEQSSSQIRSMLGKQLRTTISQETGSTLGLNKLSYSNSLKSLQNDSVRYSELQYENKILKAQIANLKKQIKYSRENKSQQIIHFQHEISKLKNIIQKGYFSIRGLQKQHEVLKSDHYTLKDKYFKCTERVLFLEQKMVELINYIKNVKCDHEKQVKLIWQRVSHLQRNLEAVVQLIQQDRNQEKFYHNTLRKSRNQVSSSKTLKYY